MHSCKPNAQRKSDLPFPLNLGEGMSSCYTCFITYIMSHKVYVFVSITENLVIGLFWHLLPSVLYEIICCVYLYESYDNALDIFYFHP